jgi:AraC-like DNA-binding protein
MPHRSRQIGRGERALMRAVLFDAMRCLAGEVGSYANRPRLAAQARAWIESRDTSWPYAFENVCHALDLMPDRVRERLLGMAVELGEEEPPRRRSRLPPPAVDDILASIRAGEPLRVVAARFRMTASRLSALSGRLASRLKAERDRDIRSLRAEGWTVDALAERFGLSRGRIYRICAGRAEPNGDGSTV